MLLALTQGICIIWTALALPEFLTWMLVQVKAPGRKQQQYWKISQLKEAYSSWRKGQSQHVSPHFQSFNYPVVNHGEITVLVLGGRGYVVDSEEEQGSGF